MEQNTAEAAAKPKQAEKPETPMAKAGRVANLVNLERVSFLQFSGHGLTAAERIRNADFTHTIGFSRPKISRAGGAILVSSTLVFSVLESASGAEEHSGAGGSREALASLRATIELKYLQKDEAAEIDTDDLREFANVNVPFNAWGYWREFIQSGMARLGFASTVALPLFRVQTAKDWMFDEET